MSCTTSEVLKSSELKASMVVSEEGSSLRPDGWAV